MTRETCVQHEPFAPSARGGLPRRRWYPLAGALLSLGAPLGYLLVRFASASARGAWPGIHAELAQESSAYTYMSIATLCVFVLIGWLFGRKEDDLERISSTDVLTGLWSRRHVRERLAQEIERALRYETKLSLLLLDLDGLKAINDERGHAAGDRALARVGECLRATCRASDVPGRYGGDEFVVVVPETGGERALELAERIRHAVRQSDPSAPIAVSIGVADLTVAGAPTIDALYEAADRALYQAKSQGRDRSILDRGADPASARVPS